MVKRTLAILMAISFAIFLLTLNISGVLSQVHPGLIGQAPEDSTVDSTVDGTFEGLVENKWAEDIVVHISDGSKSITFYTFAKIGFVRSTGFEFTLESIPSEDKQPFYQYIDKNMKKPYPDRFEVDIDLVAADGTIIETLNYNKCIVTSYFVYSNDSKGKYRFSDSLPAKMELRDIIKFECNGFSLTV